MSAFDPVGFTRELVDIDSTTGREGAAGRLVRATLERLGYVVERHAVDGDRENLFASANGTTPVVVFSTHFDCVPPFFPSRVEGERLFGRGACDAKGILAAQVAACERLRSRGESRVGLLFVVGEERGSDGALAANGRPRGSSFLINGEPTDNRLARATRGVLRVRLVAHGRAAHSSYPHLGESAIEKIVDAIVALRGIALPASADFGATHYTIGVISGGVAPNVVPAHAECEVLFRTVGPAVDVRAALAPLDARVDVEHVLDVPPVRLETVDGFPTETFPYTTDIPLLGAWGRPLLYGPGSVLVAHTDHEHVEIPALHAAVDGYAALAAALLARDDAVA
jgi:acetylornithine deacetylase